MNCRGVCMSCPIGAITTVTDMDLELEILLRVVLAGVLGAAVGFDRQRLNKPAGLRTHMLVAIGSALFVGAGLVVLADPTGDTEVVRVDILRVVAAVATGIGFLGAGVIFQSAGTVRGLTTAAGIWVTAAIGLLAGLGMILLSIGAAAVAVVVIAVLSGDIIPGAESGTEPDS